MLFTIHVMGNITSQVLVYAHSYQMPFSNHAGSVAYPFESFSNRGLIVW